MSDKPITYDLAVKELEDIAKRRLSPYEFFGWRRTEELRAKKLPHALFKWATELPEWAPAAGWNREVTRIKAPRGQPKRYRLTETVLGISFDVDLNDDPTEDLARSLAAANMLLQKTLAHAHLDEGMKSSIDKAASPVLDKK